jgi:hypothetical protein
VRFAQAVKERDLQTGEGLGLRRKQQPEVDAENLEHGC